MAPGTPAEPPPKPERRVLLHRAALRPGAVLFLGLLGYTGFLAFAALHAEEVGIANTGTVFTGAPSPRASNTTSGNPVSPKGAPTANGGAGGGGVLLLLQRTAGESLRRRHGDSTLALIGLVLQSGGT